MSSDTFEKVRKIKVKAGVAGQLIPEAKAGVAGQLIPKISHFGDFPRPPNYTHYYPVKI